MAYTTIPTVSGGDTIASTWGNAVKANFDAQAAYPSINLDLTTAFLPISGIAGAGLEQVEYGTAAPKVNAVQARFDGTGEEWLQWQCYVPRDYGTSAAVQLKYYMATAVGGTVIWGVRIAAISDGDTAVTSKEYGTATTTGFAVPGAAAQIGTATVTIGDMNGAVAGDWINVGLYRDADATGDNAGGDAVLIGARLIYNVI